MAASTTAFAAVGSVVLTSTMLASTNSFRSTSSLTKLAPLPAAARVQRVVAARASQPRQDQDQSKIVTRRDVLSNLVGAGAAMGFVGNALAANPGTLPRSLNVKKKEEKPEGKKE